MILNIYDLNPINCILSPVGFGLYHSGVEINNIEYSFASKGSGIFKIQPKKAKGVRFHEQVVLGVLEGNEEEEVERALQALRSNFHSQDYDLITKNCNHFCDAFVQELLGKPLPGYVNRMCHLWAASGAQCLIPEAIRHRAPTGDKKLKAYGGLVPFAESILQVSLLVAREWIVSSSSISEDVSSCFISEVVSSPETESKAMNLDKTAAVVRD